MNKKDYFWHVLFSVCLAAVGWWFFGWIGLFALALPHLFDAPSSREPDE